MLSALERYCLDINKVKNSFEVEELKKFLDNFIYTLEAEYPDERYSLEIRRIKKNLSKGIKIAKNTN